MTTTKVACPTCDNTYTARKDGQPRYHGCAQLCEEVSAEIRENRDGPRRCGNTVEGLTHSSDLSREGLAMKATRNVTLPAHAAERILRERTITDSGCWEWDGWRDRDGYGFVSLSANYLRVHRVAAALWLDLEPSRSDLYVCHHCDNPPCFNPDHLFIGTPLDNRLDASAKGRLLRETTHPRQKPCASCGREYAPDPDHRGRSTTCSPECSIASRAAKRRGRGRRVTPDMAQGILAALADGMTGRDAASLFGVSACTVSELKTGKRAITR